MEKGEVGLAGVIEFNLKGWYNPNNNDKLCVLYIKKIGWTVDEINLTPHRQFHFRNMVGDWPNANLS